MRRTRAQTVQHRAELAEARALEKRPTRSAAAATKPAPPPPEPRPESSDCEDNDNAEADEDAASAAGGSMTEYERKRLENIQRNLEFMRSMGVSTAKIAARTAASVPVAQRPAPTTRGISTKRKPSEPPAPRRKSRRLEGQTAGDLMLRDDKNPFTIEERQRREEPARFDAKLAAEALNLDGDGGQQLLAAVVGEYDESERDLKVDAAGLDTVRYTLAEADVVKAAEERIYSIAFHPRSDRVIVASGDKRGNVSLWHADAAEDDDNVVAMYRPHTLPTTQLHFRVNDASKLLSASFDGTVRQFDLKAATFTELFATADHTGITSLATTPHRDQLLASGDDGHVWTLDLRQPSATHAAYLVHEKKVQTVHQHPTNEFCFATASLDRTVCLWDSRRLKKTGSAPLATLPHHRSVNCAYFNPTGQHLVTVGQDDYLHVYATHDATHVGVKPALRIPHNNQTGRWLTKLHAAWDPKRPDEYVLGCMQQPRRVQLFHATRKSPIQELSSPLFASVHSINVFHPSLPLIAGGNSSGRLCLWRGQASE